MTPPVVADIWRYPVKSMSGESLRFAEVAASGLAGDRAYAVVDAVTRRTATAAMPRPWGKLLLCQATFVDEPATSGALPPVRIEFPDGTATRSDSGNANRALSAYLGVEVELERTTGGGQGGVRFSAITASDPSYWRQVLEPFTVSPEAGDRRVVAGNVAPLHIVTTASLRRVESPTSPHSGLAARLRCNLVVECLGTAFVENDWVGETISIGGPAGARVGVVMPTPRCVVPTLPTRGQPDRDRSPLQAAVSNRLELPALGVQACLGVYADVVQPGLISVGDRLDVPT